MEYKNTMEKLTEQWQVIVFTIIITLIGNIVFSSWQISKSKVDNSASVEYVDKKDAELNTKIVKVDTDLNAKVEKKADKDVIEKMSRQIEFLYQNEIQKQKR